MARLTFGGGTEYGRHIVVALDVGFAGKVQIAAVRLGLTGERVFQILFGFAAFQRHGFPSQLRLIFN